jgi:hypothetical protein
MGNPSFDEINELEAASLENRWKIIRYAIGHPGEKGAAAEFEVIKLLREILPAEYGLTTGFIAHIDNERFPDEQNKPIIGLTTQLDVIIYDALRCSPLVNLGTCSVVPLEAVYGYVEVKGCLYENKIQEILEQSKDVRCLKRRFYYITKGSVDVVPKVHDEREGVVSVRSFIICLSSEGLNQEALKEKLERTSSDLGGDTFISGMLVLGSAEGFYQSHAVKRENKDDEENRFKVCCLEENPLAAFKWSLINGLTRFPRFPETLTPALNLYSGHSGKETVEMPHSTNASLTIPLDNRDHLPFCGTTNNTKE